MAASMVENVAEIAGDPRWFLHGVFG